MTTTTIIYACGCIRKIETDQPLTKEQRQAERDQRCPSCRLHEPENVFGYGGDIKAGGVGMNSCKDCRFAKKRFWIFGEMMCRSKDLTHGISISCIDARIGCIVTSDRAVDYHIRHCPHFQEIPGRKGGL